MNSISSSNKRILKNTAFLYARMLVMMFITLYTSRIVLQDLGVSDFGSYNVVGGIIVVFSFLSGPLTTACQRFINYEMGKSDHDGVRIVFSSSVVALSILLLFVVVLGETVGLWFLNNRMNIPLERLNAANWVFHISVITFVVNTLSVPYNAVIIAHEKMSVFAYISILEAVLKLLVAVNLKYVPYDRLIYYAASLMIAGVVVRIIYQWYCVRHFEESVFYFRYVKKEKLKKLFDFSKWTILGGVRFVLHTQGIAIIINMFFGVIANAAQGIANQINSVVFQFVNNFLTAMNPQIIQSYASGNLKRMHFLIINGCKLAIFMVALLIIPLVVETHSVLCLWLNRIPDYTVIFVRSVLMITLIESFAAVLQTSNNATGVIKYYQLSLAMVGLLHLPITWIFFKMGYNVYFAMYIYVVLAIILQLVRIMFVCNGVKLSFSKFLYEVVFRCSISVLIAFVPPCLMHVYMPNGLGRLILICCASFFWTSMVFFFIGISSYERGKIICFAKGKFKYGRTKTIG